MDGLRKYGAGSYEEFRDRLGNELQKEAESFVRIGYMLKVARDTDVLAGSGYGSVAEFAAAEYGISRDVVSRYIAINDRYSEGGYSEELQERYRKYGYAKLSEMLTLPQVVVDAVPLEATREEIRQLKRELREEEQVTPMELEMEAEAGAEEKTLLVRMLREYYHGKPGEYERMHEAVRLRLDLYGELTEADVMDIVAPSGNVVMVARVGGVGRVMLVVKESGRPELLTVRTGEKAVCGWPETGEALKTLAERGYVEDNWEELYGEAFPLAEAYRQQETEKKEAAVKVSRPEKVRTDAGRKENASPGGKKEKKERAKAAGPKAGSAQPDRAGGNGPETLEDRRLSEARRLLGVIGEALGRGNPVTARRAARMLAELLDGMCSELAQADLKGQMDMEEFMSGKG